MQLDRLKQEWRIWICPCLFLQIYASVLVLFFQVVSQLGEMENGWMSPLYPACGAGGECHG